MPEVVMDTMHEIREELRQPAIDLRGLIPDVMKGFAQMAQAAMAEGELSTQTKELIALAVSITRECDGCIVAHARGALRAGATRQQVAESIGVTIALNGGPGTVWGPRALRVYDEAAAEYHH
jgi:AhpD family alkylhydroperoxidase